MVWFGFKGGAAPIPPPQTSLFDSPLSGMEATGLIFMHYFLSGTFFWDTVGEVVNQETLQNLFQRRFSRPRLLTSYSQLLQSRLLRRCVECGVAMVLARGPPFCRNAVSFYSLYSIVQQYRFSQLWLTRAFRSVGRTVYPAILRRFFRVEATDPSENPIQSFFEHPPRPSKADPFSGMPSEVADALRYYRHSLETRPLYSVVVGDLISNVADFLIIQVRTAHLYFDVRHRTSSWYFWKRYFAMMASLGTQAALSTLVRTMGVIVGRTLTRDPTGSGMFWCQHLFLLACFPLIQTSSALAKLLVFSTLDRAYPPTAEDEAEEAREEAAEPQEAPPIDDASQASLSPGGVDYYQVLGIKETADANEIKRSYRQLALSTHPDRVDKDEATQQRARNQMAIINEAYETLINDEKRASYDLHRMFAVVPGIFVKLNELPAALGATLGALVCAGVAVPISLVLYAQYGVIYHRITELGSNLLAG